MRGEARRGQQQQIQPMVFIIPGAIVLLLIIIVAASAGGGGSYGQQQKKSSSSSGYARKQQNLTAGEKLLAEGRSVLARAQAMPASAERNRVYKQAAGIFDRAHSMLQSSGQRNKATEARQYKYACMKYSTE